MVIGKGYGRGTLKTFFGLTDLHFLELLWCGVGVCGVRMASPLVEEGSADKGLVYLG